ncbi:MAG: iron-containing alcohol dehydrogenase [Rikenellaceae bacterium]
MNNFVFQNPTKLVMGKGQIAQLSTLIPSDAKVMITMGGGSIFKNGVYDQVVAALEGREWVEFRGIEPNPEFDTLMKAVAQAKAEGVNFFLAVGGGSVIDGTKFIATAMVYEGDPWEFMLDESKATAALPLATVLTLPATGSEMNNGAVVSRRTILEKRAFHNPKTYPAFSILDPEAIFSLPKNQVSNGIVDTFAHVLEQYLTTGAERTMVMDRFAEGLMLNLIELAPELLADKMSYDAAANFMLTATMGLNGFVSMGTVQDWATHMIGHELTALHGLDHGVTLAIVHPALMDVMRDEKHAKLVQFAERVWGVKEGSDDQKIDAAIEALEKFYRSLGKLTRLSEHNITEETITEIEKRFTERGWRVGERGVVTPQKARAILERAM